MMGRLWSAVTAWVRVLRAAWHEGMRAIFVGLSASYGIGVLAPWFVSPWDQDLPDEAAMAIGWICAVSFLATLVIVAVIERAVERSRARE